MEYSADTSAPVPMSRQIVFGALFLGALLLAGCSEVANGSDSDSSGSDPTASTEAPVSSETEAPTPDPTESQSSAIASPDAWTETSLTRQISFEPFTQQFSPDGRWLAISNPSELCFYSLEVETQPTCVEEEETYGGDTLDWKADSTALISGGSLSGRLNTTGVWQFEPDGSGLSVNAVEPGIVVLPDAPQVLNVGMAYRRGAESIVFVEADLNKDLYRLMEVDVDGQNLTELALLDHFFWTGGVRVSPLEDGRVLVNDGAIDEPTVDIIDGGRSTFIAAGEEVGPFAKARLVTQATEAAGGLALVAFPGVPERALDFDPSQWSVFDFEGNEFPLAVPEGQHVVAGTLSPDGTHVAYLAVDVSNPEDRNSPLAAELFVSSVDGIVAGQPTETSKVLDIDARTLSEPDPFDLDIMRWTGDDRILIPLHETRVVTVVEIDLSGR